MSAVVADTGPLHYLVLIEQIDILPRLFGTVFVPTQVHAELDQPDTPKLVRAWAHSLPPWLSVRPVSLPPGPSPRRLDDGERAAIELATLLHAELVLMDDRAGVAAARATGLAVTGTLGLLITAARHGLVDLTASLERLKATNFRYRPALFDEVLARHRP